jgi:hypothetical protein
VILAVLLLVFGREEEEKFGNYVLPELKMKA